MIYQSVLTFISDFFLSSEVVTTWQIDSTAHKLKPRSFYKSAYLWVHSADFHPSVNCAWHCIRETQENSIESSLQNSLSYILLQMVHASYCAPCPKWLCVRHEANMWCPCCMILLCSRTFYFLLLSPIINVVTTPSDVTDVTVWQITSNPNPRVLKIEKWK